MLRIAFAFCALLSCAMAVAGDPTVDAMKADLEARLEIYERLSNLEARVRALESRPAVPAKSAGAIAAEAPTPHSEVARLLELAQLSPDDVLIDPGCGDGRALIAAVEQYDVKKARGIEIDPQQAALARERVKDAGLADRIEILEGDSRTVDWGDATVAFAYLYGDLLTELQPKFSKLRTVVTYMHPVPGLEGKQHGTAYLWRPGMQVAETKPQLPPRQAPQESKPVTKTVMVQKTVVENQYVAPWRTGAPCGNGNCVMCYGGYRQVSRTIMVPQTVVEQPVVAKSDPPPQRQVQQPVQLAQSQGFVQYGFPQRQCVGRNCAGGNCYRGGDDD